MLTQNQYATLVYFWFGHPQPERIDEILGTLETAEWARLPERQLPMAGTVMAFHKLYPDRMAAWRVQYPWLHRAVSDAVVMATTCPEWVDFHFAQWFILRSEKCLDAVLDRIADGGDVGISATMKVQQLAAQSPTFRKGFERARESRKLAMLIH